MFFNTDSRIYTRIDCQFDFIFCVDVALLLDMAAATVFGLRTKLDHLMNDQIVL